MQPLALSLALFALVTLGGCREDEISAIEPIFTIHVRDDGLEPDNVSLRVPDNAAVTVVNDTDETCMFSFGPWVNDLEAAAHTEASAHFAASDAGVSSASMECKGRPDLTGRIEVLPGTGSAE